MNPIWFLMLPAFAVFCAGAYCSYTKAIRDHWVYLPAFVILTMLCGWLWVVASRNLGKDGDAVKEIMFFSLVWDVLMIVAYYALPLLIKGESFNWQAYVAAGLAMIGIVWFKVATG
jgi:hypothetical protein